MEKQEALQWFVNFGNMALDEISPGDRAKLLVEAEEYLWPMEELKEYQGMFPLPLTAKQLKRLAWALEIPTKESREHWTAILQSQKTVQQLFLRYIIPVARPLTGVAPAPPVPSIVIRGQDEMLWWVGKGYKFPYKIKFLPVTESQEDYLHLKLFTLLEGFPDHAIKVCPGCKKYFLNTSLRKKEFCSPKCMWRVIAGKRRKELKEKHPKKYKDYLKKQKAIMKQRYVEKRRKQLGFKVKVGRKS
ncbi:MAG: hypothetical protein ACLQGU_17785 [bacterium]